MACGPVKMTRESRMRKMPTGKTCPVLQATVMSKNMVGNNDRRSLESGRRLIINKNLLSDSSIQ
jgi:hypothetical protein